MKLVVRDEKQNDEPIREVWLSRAMGGTVRVHVGEVGSTDGDGRSQYVLVLQSDGRFRRPVMSEFAAASLGLEVDARTQLKEAL